MRMTREAAIEYFESLLKRFEEMYETETSYWGKVHAETTIEATRLALSALRPVSRERVEKVWRGEWIDKRILSGAPSECSKCGYWVFENLQDMEFCPHCGAPMTDESVDIVLRRLEALKDGKGD